MSQPTEPSSHGIWSPSFQGLLWTQWLTSINDNVFRWFVIGVGKNQFVPEDQGTLLIIGSSFFIIPYILFASVAGWLADRFRKRTVIIGCKIAEIAIMIIGVIAVSLLGEPDPASGIDPFFWILLAAVFLMGLQSALFSPAKFGTIPELLNEKTIAAGNGVFNLATLSATVIGMAIGGGLSDITNRGQDNIGLAAGVLVGIAVAGTILSFLVWSLPAANAKAKFPITLIGETIKDIFQLFSYRTLFRIALGISFFWAIAAFAQLNIDVFATESGGIIESDRTPLLIAVVLGIGFGSVAAGIVSAGRIELGLVPIGATGVAIFSFLLWFAPADFINGDPYNFDMIMTCTFLAGLGFSAGVFDVPLASYLQHNSPIEKRGSILAATNCLAFSSILIFFGVMLFCTQSTEPGTIAQLPAELRAESLSEEQKQQLSETVGRFEKTLIGNQPGIEEFVSQAAVPLRPATLTLLIAKDTERRITDSKPLRLEDYVAEFNSDTSNLSEQESIALQRQIFKVQRQIRPLPLLSSRQIFLVMCILTLPVIAYSLYLLIKQTVRLLFYLAFHMIYRVRINGIENLPKQGGAVVVANHSSWLDGAILLVLVPRLPRVIAWAGNFSHWAMQKWAAFCGIILITGGPKSIRNGLNTAKQAIDQGDVVGLFPEGGISRDCQIKNFKPGLTKIIDLKENKTPIVPIYFDQLWGSIFSFSQGKSIKKFPRSFRRPLSVHIGEPIIKADTMFAIRQSVQELSATTMDNPAGKFVSAPSAFIKACKRNKFRSKIGDSTNQEETGGKLLTRALILRRLLKQHVLDKQEENVAVLIPPSVGGAVVNLALALDKRVAINLNYSLSNDLINHCVKEAEIKTVLTTRKIADKFNFDFDCNIFYLDELKDKVSGVDKLIGIFQSFVLPGALLDLALGLNQIKPDDTLTVVFTSGSTGVPKGVMLTHKNIMSNVLGIERVGSLVPNDTLIGVLPFFHSMGYTVTLWVPMTTDSRGVYHFNPLDSKIVGKIAKKFSATIIVATPTFLRSYMRRCTPDQFKSVNMVIAGAERLPPELCEEFENKFGVRPVEGYGTTELSPVAAVNIPYSRQSKKKFQIDAKEGTVGRPMPNMAARVTDLDSNEVLGPNQPGMLWICGPSVMKGYLNKPEATAEVLDGKWYKTGDVAIIDDDGFIKITGRMSRFSKIGGEMVPHLKIEEVLSEFLDSTPSDDSDDHLFVAVTAVPDEKKGERLIVLYTKTPKTVDDMQQALKDAGLPNIFIPTTPGFIQVDHLPILGTGKLDLRGIKEIALENAGT